MPSTTKWEKLKEMSMLRDRYSTFYPYRVAKHVFDRSYTDALLKFTNGNVTQAARIAGKDRKDFYDLMRRADVDPKRYRK